MNVNGAITEYAKVAASTVGTANTTPLNGGAIDMAEYDKVDFIFSAGALSGAETADALVQSDTVSNFSDTPATVAQTTAEVLDDNQVAIISIRAADLPAGDRYVRGQITGSGATGGACSIVAIGTKRSSNQDSGSATVPGEIDAVVERIIA